MHAKSLPDRECGWWVWKLWTRDGWLMTDDTCGWHTSATILKEDVLGIIEEKIGFEWLAFSMAVLDPQSTRMYIALPFSSAYMAIFDVTSKGMAWQSDTWNYLFRRILTYNILRLRIFRGVRTSMHFRKHRNSWTRALNLIVRHHCCSLFFFQKPTNRTWNGTQRHQSR